MTNRKRPKPARDPLARVKPIHQPHSLVHRCDSWELYHVHGSPWPWYRLKFVRRRQAQDGNPRNTYWLSWSVEERRFARSADAQHFIERSPDTFAWLLAWMPKHFLERVRADRSSAG